MPSDSAGLLHVVLVADAEGHFRASIRTAVAQTNLALHKNPVLHKYSTGCTKLRSTAATRRRPLNFRRLNAARSGTSPGSLPAE
jgi:hypothetical protein